MTAVIVGAYEDAATAIAALAPAGGKRRAAVLPRAAVDDEARVRLRLMTEQGAWRNGLAPHVRATGPDGSRPVQVTQFSASDVFTVRWLPDSRRLAVSAGRLSRDAVLIRSFR